MRGCGVLLHITSLPGKGGVGSLGAEARKFVDFLAAAGQSWWQVLPLTPPAQGNSPYSSYSVFAGNPALISLETLEEEGLLAYWSRKFLPKHTGERANYDFNEKVHLPMLRQSFRSGYSKKRAEVDSFREDQCFWVEDYALYMAIRQQQDDLPFQQWPQALLRREPDALARAKETLRDEVDFWVWTQYLFFRQWNALRKYAKKSGVGIIGDMPLYPNVDSADVWANPDVFQLDDARRPTMVAGVPPDAFTANGQLWGNPLYNWERLTGDGFRWWMERLKLASQMYSVTRLDHFRGLSEYYAIPCDAATAREGVWRPGPGMEFIRAIRKYVPDSRLIAEDLGHHTPELAKLLEESGLPGMKVLQFAFDPTGDSLHLPHHYTPNSVAYTGTHDNDTFEGWIRSAPQSEVDFASKYMRLTRREGAGWGAVRTVYASSADTVIIPIQDYLGFGSGARMNVPGVAEGNWCWRLNGYLLTDRLAARMRELALLYRRMPRPAVRHCPETSSAPTL